MRKAARDTHHDHEREREEETEEDDVSSRVGPDAKEGRDAADNSKGNADFNHHGDVIGRHTSRDEEVRAVGVEGGADHL